MASDPAEVIPSSPAATARTVFGAAAMIVASVLPIALLAAFAVRVERSLAITDAQVGAALSTFFGVSVLFAIWGGRLADRLGPTRSRVFSAGLTSVALLGSAGLARSYPVLLAFFAVAGIGQAVAAPTSNVILAAGVRTERIGVAMGAKQASVPLGAFLAGTAVALTSPDLSWRVVFAVAVIVPAIAIGNAVALPSSGRTTSNPGPVRAGVVKLRDMWRFPLAGAMSTFSASAVTGFVVLGLVDARFAESTAGLVLTIAGLGSVAVRFGSGYLRDRLRFRAVNAVMVLLGCGAVGFLLMISGVRALVPVGAVLAFSAGWGWPAMFQLTLVETFPQAPGAATGIARLGLAGGNSLGPLFFGVLFQAVGYRVGWTLAGLWMLAAIVAVRAAATHAAPSEQDVGPGAHRS
jgi:MFS family permease